MPLLRAWLFFVLTPLALAAQPQGSAHQRGEQAYQRGDYARAASLFRQALADSPEDALHRARLLGGLGFALRGAGEYAESEAAFRQSLALRERRLGPDHADVGQALDRLAGAVQLQSRFAEAEPLYRRALDIRERALGPGHVNVGVTLNNLALLYRVQARYAEAEPLYRRSLELQERALGPEHPQVATALNNLGTLYGQQGRRDEAERLYRRALAIREAVLGEDHPDAASSASNIAVLLNAAGRQAEAETLYLRALATRESRLGAAHPLVGQVLNNLGLVYQAQGRSADAEQVLQRALVNRERALGPEHPDVANTLSNLADVQRAQARFVEAEPLLRRALAIRERVLGAQHPFTAAARGNLAELLADTGRFAEALVLARRATALLAGRASAVHDQAHAGALAKQRRWSGRFLAHLSLLARAAPEAVAEAFEVIQLARVSDTAEQVAQMAARHAAGDDALARAARETQDRRARLRALESQWLDTRARPARERDAGRDALQRTQLEEARAALATIEAQVAREFPLYAELTSAEPLALAEAQRLLAPSEAMVAFLAAPRESFVVVVRRDRARLVRLSIGRPALEVAVRRLRSRLDLGDGQALQPYDAELAHRLYQQLFAPIEPELAGAEAMLVVPDGALTSLPPGVLLAEPPPGVLEGARDYARLDWLARRHAITVLPAVSSLRALRRFARPARAAEPFGAFGDPLLAGAAGVRGAGRAALQVRGALADVDEVRRLARLPESADELRAMAAALRGSAGSVRLGPQATERAVKEADLTRYRVLAFATHGLMAGEFRGLGEPALVLTPPERGTALDDGLLTASEISLLRMDADWVVLSACNTAAADGTPGAEGLSGLAKAFFYAGARSLLVSHWAVSSEATVALTTRMFEEVARGAPRAEAHRRAVLALLGGEARPEFAHPSFWAPFIVVGEGGAGP